MGGEGLMPDQRDHLFQQYLVGRSAEAFTEIVHQYRDMVFRICFRRLAHVDDANDATQETFAVLLAKAHSLKPFNLKGFLAKAARFSSSELARRRYRRAGRERSIESADQLRSVAANIWDASEALRRRETVDRAVAQLRRTDQEVLNARYVEGLTVGEVARRLAISQAAVSQRSFRALRRLRNNVRMDC
jgi:RNA polymerase sigma-70 factor (ECF subfamily)